MLQTILGLDADRIASAYLVSPAAMAKRLVRAKNKIRISKIPFVVPEIDELADRTAAVLEAIYGAYGLGHDHVDGGAVTRVGLADEAIYLARMLSEVLPQSAETLGLLSLMLFSAARAGARRDAAGAYVPLEKQNPKLWRVDFIIEADAALRRAAAMQAFGPFQLEAAIQAVHTARGVTGNTDWQAICRLYAGLIDMQPTVGARVGYAAALMQNKNLTDAEDQLAIITGEALNYQPYWAVQAELMLLKGDRLRARDSFKRAAALAGDGAIRQFLYDRMRATNVA